MQVRIANCRVKGIFGRGGAGGNMGREARGMGARIARWPVCGRSGGGSARGNTRVRAVSQAVIRWEF